jgi:hypothetical protein
MAIPFNPPQELINSYLSRKQPAEVASEGMQQALQSYVALKQQEKAQQQADFGNYLKLLETDPELAKTPIGQQLSKRMGGSLGGYQPPSASTGTLPSQPPAQPPADQPVAGTTPPGATSAVIAHLQSIGHPMGQLSGQSQTPSPLGPNAIPPMIMGRGKLGEKANKDVTAGLERKKLVAGLDASEPASFDEVRTTFKAAGKPDLGEELIANATKLGDNAVQRKSVDAAIKGLGVAAQAGRGQFYSTTANVKEQTMRDALIKEARTTLDPYFQHGAGNQLALKFNRIAGAEPLVQQMLTQAGGGDTRQMRELGTSVANIITGGNVVAQNQVEEMIPKTYQGNLNAFLEKLKNEPTGLEQQAFIKRFAETIAREKAATQAQSRAIAERNAPTLRVLKSNYPEDYQAVVDQYLNQSPEIMGPGANQPQSTGGWTYVGKK